LVLYQENERIGLFLRLREAAWNDNSAWEIAEQRDIRVIYKYVYVYTRT